MVVVAPVCSKEWVYSIHLLFFVITTLLKLCGTQQVFCFGEKSPDGS
jgi:hypothetical protein